MSQISYSVECPGKDNWIWANKFIAVWLEICPELDEDILLMRDEYMTEVEIAHELLDAVAHSFAARAPRLPPPGILSGE